MKILLLSILGGITLLVSKGASAKELNCKEIANKYAAVSEDYARAFLSYEIARADQNLTSINLRAFFIVHNDKFMSEQPVGLDDATTTLIRDLLTKAADYERIFTELEEAANQKAIYQSAAVPITDFEIRQLTEDQLARIARQTSKINYLPTEAGFWGQGRVYNDDNSIDVNAVEMASNNVESDLSRIQKLICRVFK